MNLSKVCFLAYSVAWAQQGVSQNTSGSCNPATVAGGKVTITCQGLDPALIKQLHQVLNKIAANQLNPNAVMVKLDELQAETHEIKVGVEELRKKQEGRRLSADQKANLIQNLKTVPPQHKTSIQVLTANGTTESTRFAEDFRDVFAAAGWNVEMNSFMAIGGFTKGQSMSVKSEDNKAASYVQQLFRGVGFPLKGSLRANQEPDLIEITIWPIADN